MHRRRRPRRYGPPRAVSQGRFHTLGHAHCRERRLLYAALSPARHQRDDRRPAGGPSCPRSEGRAVGCVRRDRQFDGHDRRRAEGLPGRGQGSPQERAAHLHPQHRLEARRRAARYPDRIGRQARSHRHRSPWRHVRSQGGAPSDDLPPRRQRRLRSRHRGDAVQDGQGPRRRRLR